MTRYTSEQWDKVVEEYKDYGMTAKEIAADLGKIEASVYIEFAKRSAFVTPEHAKTLRQKLARMPIADAYERALDALELVSWVNPELPHPTDCVKIGSTLRRILRALHDAGGRTMSKESLLYALIFDRPADDIPEIGIVAVYICRLRAALKGHPWDIKTVWGTGWHLKERESVE